MKGVPLGLIELNMSPRRKDSYGASRYRPVSRQSVSCRICGIPTQPSSDPLMRHDTGMELVITRQYVAHNTVSPVACVDGCRPTYVCYVMMLALCLTYIYLTSSRDYLIWIYDLIMLIGRPNEMWVFASLGWANYLLSLLHCLDVSRAYHNPITDTRLLISQPANASALHQGGQRIPPYRRPDHVLGEKAVSRGNINTLRLERYGLNTRDKFWEVNNI